jgi:hypothetical protein
MSRSRQTAPPLSPLGKLNSELDSHPARISVYLCHLGVEPEVTVPLVSIKSTCMVVPILAVMKVGRVFVPLDPAPGRPKGKTFAILTLRGLHTTDNGKDNKPLQLLDKPHDLRVAKEFVSEVQNYIAATPPAYMHSSVIAVVNQMPLNSSGKLETQRVAQWIDYLNEETYGRIVKNLADAELDTESDSAQLPVIHIISKVVAKAQVPLRSSFISMGASSSPIYRPWPSADDKASPCLCRTSLRAPTS